MVTLRLADAIGTEGLSGATIDDPIVTVDPQLQEFFPEVVAALPVWKWLKIAGHAGDDFWLDEGARLHISRRAHALLSRFQLSAARATEDQGTLNQ